MRGAQRHDRHLAADTSDVKTSVMGELQQRVDRDMLEKQRRDLQKLQHRQQLASEIEVPSFLPTKEPTTVRPSPKPVTKKFSTKIPVSKRTTLEPVRMGEGLGGGLKATVKFE